MRSPLPHSSAVAKWCRDYLREVTKETTAVSGRLTASSIYRGIYRNSLAACYVLCALKVSKPPYLKHAAESARKLPLLISCCQVSPAYAELRRYVEDVVWFPYFSEHPIEWEERTQRPEQGTIVSHDDPVAYCAHREFAWYVSYARKRLRGRGVKTIAVALNDLSKSFASLSSHVHAPSPSSSADVNMGCFESVSDRALKPYQTVQRRVLSAGCLVAVASVPDGLAKLEAIDRAWFDWLIGSERSKAIRSGPFGQRRGAA